MAKIPSDLGHGGSHEDTDLKLLLIATVDSLNSLKAAHDDLAAKYNQHIADGKHRVASAVDVAAPTSVLVATVSITK